MVTFKVGIKSGIVSGAITGLIFSLVLSILFYSISTSTSDSLTDLQIESRTISEFSVFGKTADSSLMHKILIYSGLAMALGIVAGILLGVAATAIVKITKIGPAYAIAFLVIGALSAYYSQTYEKLIEILANLGEQPSLDNNLKILSISTYVMPPILFAAIEGLLLKYFLSIYMTVKFEHVTSVPNPDYVPPVEQNNSIQASISPTKNDVADIPPTKQPQSQILPGTGTALQRNIPEDLKKCIYHCVDKELPDNEIKSIFQGYGYDSKAVEDIIENRRLQNYGRTIKDK